MLESIIIWTLFGLLNAFVYLAYIVLHQRNLLGYDLIFALIVFVLGWTFTVVVGFILLLVILYKIISVLFPKSKIVTNFNKFMDKQFWANL